MSSDLWPPRRTVYDSRPGAAVENYNVTMTPSPLCHFNVDSNTAGIKNIKNYTYEKRVSRNAVSAFVCMLFKSELSGTY